MIYIKTLARLVITGLIIFFGSLAQAQSPYTDRSTAIELAALLSDGYYDEHRIISTFVQSAGDGQFFIKVILDNSAELNWNMHQLRTLSIAERINLSDNRVLLFTNNYNNHFVTLDKIVFAHKALESRILIRTFPITDVLYGKTLPYEIYGFNLLELLDIKSNVDAMGYRQHYVFYFSNGERQLLSNLGAYLVLSEDRLRNNAPEYISAPYILQEMYSFPLSNNYQIGVGKFGLELIFDSNLILDSKDIPYVFKELSPTQIMVVVVIPNAMVREAQKPINNLEYLSDIQAVNDGETPMRLLLQARGVSNVMDFPPEINVDNNRVQIIFTKVIDQSRDQLAEVDQDIENISHDELKRRVDFEKEIKSGDDLIFVVGQAATFYERYEALNKAYQHYVKATLLSYNENTLEDSLRKRNFVLVRLPQMVVSYIEEALQAEALENEDVLKLKLYLNEVSELTRDQQILSSIKTLLNLPELN